MSPPALKPYPAYKPAGVPWLQQVPEHWSSARAKSLFQKVERPVRPEDETVTCFRDGTVTLRKNRRATGYTESLKEIGYQGVRKGDLVIHVMDAFAGSVGVSDSDGKSTPVYSVCVPRGDAQPWYYTYVLREMARAGWILALAKGIRERSSDFRFDMFGAQLLPVPPVAEQHLIVRYLRALDAKVKRYIRTKRKLIAALQEQKQAIIQRAVTRGLAPNVKLKPSGVEWLGEVPEHWEVVRFKRLLKRIEQGVSPQAEAYLAEGNAWGVLKAGCVNRGVFRETEHKRLPNGYEVDESLQVKAGDVLISRASGSPSLVGSVGLVEQVNRRLILSDKTFRPVFRAERIKRFCVAAMNTPYFRHQVEQAISGAEGLANNLPLTSLKDFSLVVPPEAEAERIAKSLSRDTQQFDIGLRALEGDINLMQEYHTRLIADVVTGAVDVREVAGKLPEEDQMIGRSDDQMMEEEPLSMAAEDETP